MNKSVYYRDKMMAVMMRLVVARSYDDVYLLPLCRATAGATQLSPPFFFFINPSPYQLQQILLDR